jgi:hypothetical protein
VVGSAALDGSTPFGNPTIEGEGRKLERRAEHQPRGSHAGLSRVRIGAPRGVTADPRAAAGNRAGRRAPREQRQKGKRRSICDLIQRRTSLLSTRARLSADTQSGAPSDATATTRPSKNVGAPESP